MASIDTGNFRASSRCTRMRKKRLAVVGHVKVVESAVTDSNG